MWRINGAKGGRGGREDLMREELTKSDEKESICRREEVVGVIVTLVNSEHRKSGRALRPCG